MSTKVLQDAICGRERDYSELLQRLLDRVENDPEEYGWRQLCEAIELVRCLRRLLDGRSVAEIHKAFGAPGDFGYETPIGAALDKTYRQAVSGKSPVVASASLEVAEKSPLPECSICRGRHGREVTHACE